jgi:hypothetical protein
LAFGVDATTFAACTRGSSLCCSQPAPWLCPPPPRSGRAIPPASQADIHRYRLEQHRLQSAEQAAFARQQSLNTRLTQLEVEASRQPEPYVPLVEPLPSSRGMATPSVAGSTARREAVFSGVRQIDAWLDRDPR